MDLSDFQRSAAQALSEVLRRNGINHAVIGGFAVKLLGHKRATKDVDVQIDVGVNEVRGRIRDLLMQNDDRFIVQNNKLYFIPLHGVDILVETLPVGELGLPRQLKIIHTISGNVPVLHPGVLILTKIKRCAMFLGSTRPLSVAKVKTDIRDIKFLLDWLSDRNQHIDFANYHSANVERLYKATADLVHH